MLRAGVVGVALVFSTLPLARAAEPANPLDPVAPQPTISGEPLKQAIRTALTEANKVKGAPDDATVQQLLSLYQDLDRDTSLTDAVRQPLRRGLRFQLRRLSDAIKQAGPGAVARPATLPAPQNRVLAQQLQFGQQQPNQQAGSPPADYGQQLVELIEAVIMPQSWETVGGNGVIRYWAPGHALVVRQTGEVHEAIGQLLNDLR